MKEKEAMKKANIGLIIMVLLCFVALAFVTGCGKMDENLSFKTEYQAVFIDNGQVFFGKLENGGSTHPLLRDVYYIGRQQSPDGKEVKNILLKRGNEWHAPDFMYLTSSHIVMIEPVSATSKVAELIKTLKAQQPAAQPAQ
jgi:hypothetical protein